MNILYVTNSNIENLYPLTVKERPISSISMLGKSILNHLVNSASKAGIKKLTYLGLSSNILYKWHEKDEQSRKILELLACKKPKDCITVLDETTDYYILHIGSVVPSSEKLYSGMLARFNEVGGDIMLVIAPDIPVPERVGVNSISLKIDLSREHVDRDSIKLNGKGYIFTGIMIVRREHLSEILKIISNKMLERPSNEGSNGEAFSYEISFLLADFFRKAKLTLTYHILTDLTVYPVNTPWNLLYTVKNMLSQIKTSILSKNAHISPSAHLEGPVIIEDEAVIDHGAVIKGPAYIGRKVLVGANSFIRNHTVLEENSVIGALSEVKRTYVGKNAVIASHSHVTDSLLGDHAAIRPMTVTLNYDPKHFPLTGEVTKRGSIIGEKAIVDGGSILKPSTIVYPNTVFQQTK